MTNEPTMEPYRQRAKQAKMLRQECIHPYEGKKGLILTRGGFGEFEEKGEKRNKSVCLLSVSPCSK